jgi:hypothetical protein
MNCPLMRLAVVENLLLALLQMVVAPQARVAVSAVPTEDGHGAVRLGLVGLGAVHAGAVVVRILRECQFGNMSRGILNEQCKSSSSRSSPPRIRGR